jgi:hypothetical protein
MAILTTGNTYSAGDQVTPTNLNAIVNSATFNDPADETSIEKNTGTGKLQIKDLGVSTAKIADSSVTNAKLGSLSVATANLQTNAVTTIKITDSNVTTAKIAANAVTGAKLNTDAISAQTALTAAPDGTDELLISDAGVLKRIDVADFLKHAAIPKAYGVLDMDSGTINGGYNSGASASGTSSVRSVTMDNAMSDTNYCVITSLQAVTGSWEVVTHVIDSTSTFTITKTAQGGDPFVSFAVFGTLA